MKRLIALVLFALALSVAPRARADINLDDIVPQFTKCWGTTCVMPDASVDATMYNLTTKKWEAGVVSLGGGAVLLLMADQAYASGVCAHISGLLSQEAGQSSYALWSVGAVFARYLEISYTRSWLSDGAASQYISIAGNIPWDIFTTATIPQRAMAARLALDSK
jgi:hypothetical protein